MTRILAFVLVLCAAAASAPAQTRVPDPSTEARVRLGPVFLKPTLALTNMGIDNNVFNEPDQQLPKQDFTITVSPATDLWVRLGRTWIAGNVREDLVYYRKYASERSANSRYKLGWIVPLNRLVVAANASYLNARDRPGFEIDARSQRNEVQFDGSAELRVLPSTYLGARASRLRVNYDKAAVFLGTSLQYGLNRTVTAEEIDVRHELTPLTSLTFSGGKSQQRFEFSPDRDADSTEGTVGVAFDPFALIKGSAKVGYRDYRPVTAGLPGFQGMTLDADLSYVALGSTEVVVQGRRDIEYSFEFYQPYYVQTGFLVSVDQRIYGPLELAARFGADRLAYRDRPDVPAAYASRTDHVRTYGGSVGYRMSHDLRVAVNVDHVNRVSPLDFRQYNGLRMGMSVTYGF